MYERARTTPAMPRTPTPERRQARRRGRYHRVTERLARPANLEKLSPSFLHSSPVFTARDTRIEATPTTTFTECSVHPTFRNSVLSLLLPANILSVVPRRPPFSTFHSFSTISLTLFSRVIRNFSFGEKRSSSRVSIPLILKNRRIQETRFLMDQTETLFV